MTNKLHGFPFQGIPVPSEASEVVEPVYMEHDNLEKVSQHSCRKLGEAFNKRFFVPYWEVDSPVIADMTHALQPSFKSLKFMHGLRLRNGEGNTDGGG